MINSLLIANRGEIAVRIIRTARRLGIRTIAVFSDADRDSCHVRAADEAIRIGAAPARDSYLRADAIIEAALRSRAEAVHPGYGFLSEKPELAALCVEAGLIFVGPSADRILAMGAKIGAKQIAAGAGVACVPGYVGRDQSDAHLIEEAVRIGFPVMVKASAGGGGKGMRRVFAAAELPAALDLARREAEAGFGDPALLIERLVLRPRHLEVQIAGDRHGNLVHLFERDCSVQRNNQKVFEEAPAPNLAPAIREKLLASAVALGNAIAYDNLGTVEFILEEGQDEPWFLEMNTRLQVEHPVTEVITGLDLVEWQLRIAAGEPLPLAQHEIRQEGHAIEARVTAERADLDFRPDTGRIVGYREPRGIRIDSGVAAGTEVTQFYDSLLAKAIAVGSTREAACTRLAAGLREFSILGPATTLPFLIDAIEQPSFARGEATTRFIEEAFPGGWKARSQEAGLAAALACVLALDIPNSPGSAWQSLAGFRVLAPAGGLAAARVVITDGTAARVATVSQSARGCYRVGCDDEAVVLSVRVFDAEVEVESEGRVVRGRWQRVGGVVQIELAGERHVFTVVPEIVAGTAGSRAAAGSGAVIAAMPGVIAEVRVGEGDVVAAGEVVVILESMKLFLPQLAGAAGVVTAVTCRVGETVPAGKSLIVIS